MSRPRHPDQDIERAVQHAESLGWTVEISNGHAWGHLPCPRHTREGCIVAVWSTPRNARNHARQIRREVDACPHQPAPVGNIGGNHPLWSWREVAGWLHRNNMIKPQDFADVSEVENINVCLDYLHQQESDPDLTAEVFQALTA